MGIFIDLYLLTMVLVLWIHTKSATESLHNRNWNNDFQNISELSVVNMFTLGSITEVKESLMQLQMLANAVNKACGNNLGFLILQALFYYSTYFNVVLGNKGGTIRKTAGAAGLVLYFMEAVAILLLSGDISNKVCIF